MFVSYSASYDWLLLALLKHYHKGTYYGYKRTDAQTFGSDVGFSRHSRSIVGRRNARTQCNLEYLPPFNVNSTLIDDKGNN